MRNSLDQVFHGQRRVPLGELFMATPLQNLGLFQDERPNSRLDRILAVSLLHRKVLEFLLQTSKIVAVRVQILERKILAER